MENSLHEIKVLMEKVTKHSVKKEVAHSFQAQLPFIMSLVAKAKEQSSFNRMLLTKEARERQSLLALRNTRESRQTVGLRQFERTSVAGRLLDARIQHFFKARLHQHLFQANRWWQQTFTHQVDVTKRYLYKAGLSYQDHIANVKTSASEFLNGAFVKPATKSWDSFTVIGDSVADSFQERNEKKLDSFYDFANYLTVGIPDAVVGVGKGLDERYQTLKNDPSHPHFLNYATMGGTSEMAVNAVNPEEAYSPEHWLNSLGTASVLFTGGISATSSHMVTKSTLSSPKPSVTVPKVQEPWTANAALEWLKDPPLPNVYVVHDSLGGNHYVFSKRLGGGEGGSSKSTDNVLDGVRIINKKYAREVYKLSDDLGKKYPKGVKFSKEGFPDFSPYSKANIEIEGLIGDHYFDFKKANEAIGLKNIPSGYTWHHVEDGKTMMLVPSDIHGAVRHTGGASLINKGIRP
ncbi:HNH endonuclease [Gracilibacillus boraciitolerans]|nr:HNH endonuclease [Gracilibacillus boraciitolerans]